MPVALSFESKEDAINMLISMFPATTEAYAKRQFVQTSLITLYLQ